MIYYYITHTLLVRVMFILSFIIMCANNFLHLISFLFSVRPLNKIAVEMAKDNTAIRPSTEELLKNESRYFFEDDGISPADRRIMFCEMHRPPNQQTRVASTEQEREAAHNWRYPDDLNENMRDEEANRIMLMCDDAVDQLLQPSGDAVLNEDIELDQMHKDEMHCANEDGDLDAMHREETDDIQILPSSVLHPSTPPSQISSPLSPTISPTLLQQQQQATYFVTGSNNNVAIPTTNNQAATIVQESEVGKIADSRPNMSAIDDQNQSFIMLSALLTKRYGESSAPQKFQFLYDEICQHEYLQQQSKIKAEGLHGRLPLHPDNEPIGRNSFAVCTSLTLAVACLCNTNTVFIGETNAAHLYYLCQYLVKGVAVLSALLSVCKAAAEDMKTRPSTASDTGTEIRTTQHLWTKILNKVSVGACETSGCLAVLSLLDYPSMVSSHGFWYLYGRVALQFLKDRKKELCMKAKLSSKKAKREEKHHRTEPLSKGKKR